MREHDAEVLWHRFGSGDGSAFAQLYRDHHRDVFRYCRSLLHDEEDAHDAAQGTWTAIWTTPGAARREIPLRPWLFRVAHNEAVDILRRRRPHETLTGLEVPALDDVAGDVELRDRLATLRADLMSLPERQRAALLLREIAGLGHAEIGDVFGTSAAAAKQTIYEARRALVDAEGGRTMACGLVQHAISDGDGRVRRGRRLRAHLRGCATCRAFADDVGRRRDDLHLLFPAPAALGLVARVAAGVGGAGAGGVASGGGAVVAGGSVAAKVAVAAAVLVAAGVGGRHEIAHAGGDRAAGAAAAAPVATTARAALPAAAQRRTSVAATAIAVRPHTATPRRPSQKRAGAGGAATAPRRAAAHAAAPAAAPAVTAPAAATPQPAAVDHGQSASAPGQVKRTEAAAAAPGQVKKTGAVATPPGQAKRTGATATPPGQAKKTEAAAPTATPVAPHAGAHAGARSGGRRQQRQRRRERGRRARPGQGGHTARPDQEVGPDLPAGPSVVGPPASSGRAWSRAPGCVPSPALRKDHPWPQDLASSAGRRSARCSPSPCSSAPPPRRPTPA